MPQFACIVVDKEGKRMETQHEAVSVQDVFSFVRSKGLTPVSIKEIKSGFFIRGGLKELSSAFRLRRIKMEDVAVFFRQLATMLEAGVTLSECLESLAEQTENESLANTLRQLKEYVSWGRPFSKTLGEFPYVFTPLIRQMIAVGEEAGTLPKITSHVAEYLEGQIDLKKKISAATRYPMFISGFFLVAVGVMIFYIIPQFKEIFAGYGAQLPPLTRFVMNTSDFLIRNIIYELITVLGAGIFVFGYLRTSRGKGVFDRIKLKVPIAGKLIHYVLLSRICHTLGILLSSGVPLVVSLDHTGAVAENVVVEDAIRDIRARIVGGSTLTKEIKKHDFFPPIIGGMVHTGERSGTLSDILPKVADMYDREVDYRIKTMTSTLEPVLVVGLGILVTIFVLAMYYPIFQLSTVMGG